MHLKGTFNSILIIPWSWTFWICTTLLSRHKYVQFCWVLSHIDIQNNKRADRAAKAALNEIPSNMTIPFSDYKPYIHTYVRKKWHDFWDNQTENKLPSDVGHCPVEVIDVRNLSFPVLELDIHTWHTCTSWWWGGGTHQSVSRVRSVSQWVASLCIVLNTSI